MRSRTTVFKHAAVALGVAALGGCANSVEQAREAVQALPEQSCEVERADGTTLRATGASCDRLLADAAENEARRACSEFSAEGEGLCMMALALKNKGKDDPRANSAARDMLVAAIQADSNIKSSWIRTVPVFGSVLGNAYEAREEQKTLRTALENAGPSVGDIHFGRAKGAAGDGEGGGSASGSVDNNTLLFGNDNNLADGPGNVINEGRNPTTVGTGQPESTLDGDRVFQNEADVNEAPLVQGADDGDGGQSIIPRP